VSGELASIRGRGLLAIWSELDLAREDEFDVWHVQEHLAERVNVPGFLRARRYMRTAPPAPEGAILLTLYETVDVDVMVSPAYIERLENPTPLTRDTVPLMANMRRSALTLKASRGQGVGGHLAAWQFRPSADHAESARERLIGPVLDMALAPVGVIATHLYEPEVEATRAKDATTEGRATNTVVEAPRWLLLVEAIHERGLTEARHAIVETVTGVSDDSEVTVETFRLAVVLEGPEADQS
jgi:hypothetical protein